MVDVHGVVGGLVEAVEDADGAAGLGGGGEDREGEGLLVHDLRAAEGEDEAAGRDLRDRGRVQALVRPEGVLQRPAVLGESRRIHDHEVVLPFRNVAEELDGIGAVGGMLVGREAVQGHVPVHHVHRLLGTVHGIHMDRSPVQGIDGKAAGVAEEVQDVPSLGEPAHGRAVLALVQEEARLLALVPIDVELVPVLQDDAFVRVEAGGLVQIAVDEVQAGLEGRGAGALVIDRLQRVPVNGLEGLANGVLGLEHAHGMGLEDAHAVIVVDDKAGKAVAFAVDEPIAGGRRRPVQAAGDARLEGPAHHLRPEIGRGGILVEAQDPDGDGADLVMARGQILAVGGTDFHQVALGGFARDLGDGPGEDPGMEPEDGILAARTEIYFFHQAWSG